MEKKIMKIKSCVISGQRNLKENICRFFTERKYISGITVIELVLILVIVIALLLIFKTELINLINSIFDKIRHLIRKYESKESRNNGIFKSYSCSSYFVYIWNYRNYCDTDRKES